MSIQVVAPYAVLTPQRARNSRGAARLLVVYPHSATHTAASNTANSSRDRAVRGSRTRRTDNAGMVCAQAVQVRRSIQAIAPDRDNRI